MSAEDGENFNRLVATLRRLDATVSAPDFDPAPMLAAVERAKQGAPMPEDERQRMLALAAEAKDGPWLTTEEFIAKLTADREASR